MLAVAAMQPTVRYIDFLSLTGKLAVMSDFAVWGNV
jgi:hypothetical protein